MRRDSAITLDLHYLPGQSNSLAARFAAVALRYRGVSSTHSKLTRTIPLSLVDLYLVSLYTCIYLTYTYTSIYLGIFISHLSHSFLMIHSYIPNVCFTYFPLYKSKPRSLNVRAHTITSTNYTKDELYILWRYLRTRGWRQKIKKRKR